MANRATARILAALLVGALGVGSCRDKPAKPQPDATAEDAERVVPGRWVEVRPEDEPAEGNTAQVNPSPLSAGGQETRSSIREITALSPLLDAAVGEWARYRTEDGWLEELRVVAVEPGPDGRVTIEVRVLADGLPLGVPAERHEAKTLDWPRAAAERRAAALEQRSERVRAAGREWDCRLTVATWIADTERYEERTWVSPEAPVYGIVRSETVGAATGRQVASLELLDFGTE